MPHQHVQENTVTNGASASPAKSVIAGKDKHDIVLKTFRILIADLCQQFNGGHPGYVIAQMISAAFLF